MCGSLNDYLLNCSLGSSRSSLWKGVLGREALVRKQGTCPVSEPHPTSLLGPGQVTSSL